jgi:hypothetical protein
MSFSLAEPFSVVAPRDRGDHHLGFAGALPAVVFRWLLVLRFVLANTLGLALVAVAWMNGWIDQLLAADRTHLVAVIVAVFLAGFALCLRRLVATSRELNGLRAGRPPAGGRVAEYLRAIDGRDSATRAQLASLLRLKLAARIAPVRHIASSLVILGLIGTVIGFVIALGGIDPNAASDVSAVGPMIANLIEGMSVALHTTLVGAVLNVWLMVDYRMLESGTVRLFTQAVEYGERHARS